MDRLKVIRNDIVAKAKKEKEKVSANLKRYSVFAIAYVLLFLLGVKFGQGWRYSDGSTALFKMFNFVTGCQLAFKRWNPLLLKSFDFMFGACFVFIIWLGVYIKSKNAKKLRKNIEYGSAQWGTSSDIEPFIDPDFQNNILLTLTERMTMNSRPKNWATARNKNVLVIGGSGSGKTRYFVKPNLMQMHSSYVITDPKGSILVECGHMLKKHNYRIKVFNTINFKKSLHYNPFAYIRSEKDILKFVTVLIANTKGDGKSSDPFWEKAETLLYCALVGYMHYELPIELRTMSNLVEMVNSMEVREDDEAFENNVDKMFKQLEEKSPEHFAVRQYKKYKLAAGKTAKSILISCGARLAPFDIAELREITAYDELELDTLGDKWYDDPDDKENNPENYRKAALFLIMSDTDATFNFLISMIYSQLFNLLCEKADDVYNGRLPVHVRCLIDEFANIGQIPNFEKLIATIRSREISACIVLQAQSQLKAVYKDNSDTILGNCDTMLFLGGKESSTLKELNQMLGKETIDTFNTGESRGQGTSHSLNYQKLGRELMTIDEISTMEGTKCILQIRGVHPFLSSKYDITVHPHFNEISDSGKVPEYDIEKSLTRRPKFKANDVIEYDVVDFTA